MKSIALLITAICCWFAAQDNPKLNGVYRVEFDKKYELPTYQITFKDSIYTKKMADAVTYKGKVTYDKYKAVVRKDKEENPIEIDSRDIGKDTLKFSTKNKTDLSRTINRGKMIKIK